jgi:hypothetical protein
MFMVCPPKSAENSGIFMGFGDFSRMLVADSKCHAASKPDQESLGWRLNGALMGFQWDLMWF